MLSCTATESVKGGDGPKQVTVVLLRIDAGVDTLFHKHSAGIDGEHDEKPVPVICNTNWDVGVARVTIGGENDCMCGTCNGTLIFRGEDLLGCPFTKTVTV